METLRALTGGIRPALFLGLTGMTALLMPGTCLAQATAFNITTIAGNHTQGFIEGPATTVAELNSPVAVTLDSSGNLYIADTTNNRVRKLSGGKLSTYAGNGAQAYAGDGGAATAASLADPYGLVFDKAGNLYIADLLNHAVRQVTPGGTITTFAGIDQPGFGGDGGPASSAYINQPIGLAVDAAGNLYIADSNNFCIRVVTPDGNIKTYAGTPTAPGNSGDGGQARQAKFGKPYGIALDSAGNLYIADSSNNVVRMVAPNGIISTVAGNSKAGYSGDGGPATSAQLSKPEGVAVDAAGALYIGDNGNSRVRQVVNGVINTVAGGSFTGYTGDNGAATNARLTEPSGLFVDSSDNVYIADFGNNVIRMLAPNAPLVPSNGVISAGAFGAFPSAAPGSWIEIYGTNLAFNRRFWGSADFTGSNAPTALDGTSVTVGGQAAFVYYISGGQVNVQVPSNVSTGTQQVIVKNAAGSSAAVNITLNAAQPGLLTQYTANGVQYAAALFPDNKTYVMPPGAVSGVPSRRATAGDTITLYGIGFGPVTPAVAAGQIAPPEITSLNSQLQISIGGVTTSVSYDGLNPGLVGLYQFNVTVPAVPAGDAVPVTFSLGGVSGTQKLYLAVQ